MTNPNLQSDSPESFMPFPDKTVLSLDDSSAIVHLDISDKLFMFEQFMKKFLERITYKEQLQKEWTEQGISCSALVPGQEWQTGKLRIRVEFIPDAIEQPKPEQNFTEEEPSPLDDIRQTLLQN